MANVKFFIQGDNTSAMRAMAQVQGAVGGLANNLNGHLKGALLGAFGTAAIASAVKNTIEYADNVDEASSRIDVTIEKLQEWTFAAKQSGAAMEDVVTFTEKLSAFAASGKGAIKLQSVGINPNQTPEGLFNSVANYSKGKAPSEVTPLLKEIGGKSAGKLFNTFQMDLDEAGAQARALGAVMDTETAVALGALNDQFSILSQIIAARLGPAILSVIGVLAKLGIVAAATVEKYATVVYGNKYDVNGDSIKTEADIEARQRKFNEDAIKENKRRKEENKDREAQGLEPLKMRRLIPMQGSATVAELQKTDLETQESLEEYQKALDKAALAAKDRGKKKVTPQEATLKDQSAPAFKDPSPYVSIGGIGGVNLQYRIEALNKDMLKGINEMVSLLQEQNQSIQPDSDE